MGTKPNCKSLVGKSGGEISDSEKMEELLNAAMFSNNFGLRKLFPWSSESNSTYLNACVSDREKSYLAEIIRCTFKKKAQLRIERVENPFLWGRYVLQYEEMRAYSESAIVKEKIMIHATSRSNVENIAETNFDWRLGKRARFGKGVCYSKHAQHASSLVRRYVSTKEASYIVAGVLVANSSPGTKNQDIPKYGDDTTTGRTSDNVCIKYYDNDFYPYYIVQAL